MHMDIAILSIGLREPEWVAIARHHYMKVLSRYCTLHWHPLKEAPPSPRKCQQETDQLLLAMGQQSRQQHTRRIALTEHGRQDNSLQFAHRIRTWQQDYSQLLFIIGGADGLAPDLYTAVDEQYALSAMTMPHMLCRVVLLEQLYRAFSVLAGHPYHRA